MTINMRTSDKAMDAIILAGGLGTRLRAVVSDLPKPLAPVNGRPFLDYQLWLLAQSGLVRKATLAIGHLADRVIEHYAAYPPPLLVDFVVEPALLGTGGAARNALDATTSDQVLVLNGDSVFKWNLLELAQAHARLRPAATLALVQVDDTSRYGSVTLQHGRVTQFVEKSGASGPGAINAGVYVFQRKTLEELRLGEVASLERDVFPQLIARHQLAAVTFDAAFIDIGLPETYKAAASILDDLTGFDAGRP